MKFLSKVVFALALGMVMLPVELPEPVASLDMVPTVEARCRGGRGIFRGRILHRHSRERGGGCASCR